MAIPVSGTPTGNPPPPSGESGEPRPVPRDRGPQGKTSTETKNLSQVLSNQNAHTPQTVSYREGAAERGEVDPMDVEQAPTEGLEMWVGDGMPTDAPVLPRGPALPATYQTRSAPLPLPNASNPFTEGADKKFASSAAMKTMEEATPDTPGGMPTRPLHAPANPPMVTRTAQGLMVAPDIIPPPPPPPLGDTGTGSDLVWTQVVNKGGSASFDQNQFMWNLLIENPNKQDAYAKRSEIRKAEHQLQMKMHKILFLLLMGDVAGAVREILHQSEQFNRMFNRRLVKNLNRVRDGKAKVLTALGRKTPPRNNPSGDEKAAKEEVRKNEEYSQWTSITTQLLGTMGEAERELTGLIEEGRRGIKELKEAYQGLKEQEARTSRAVYQAFKG